jgi:signal transduction histidine kinase
MEHSMKLFQDSRSNETLQLLEHIAKICEQLAAQYNLQARDKQLKLAIERTSDKAQHRLLITNAVWALSFIASKQSLKAHLFPASQIITKGDPETALNQRLTITDEDEQIDLLVLSLFEELIRRSQVAARSGSSTRVTLDGMSVVTAVRNLVHENQSLVAQLLRQNEQIHNHIAADIHDQVLSDLMLLKKEMQKRGEIEEEMQLLDDAMNYLRDVCSGLSGKDLQTFGLMPCLRNLVNKVRRHTEIKLELTESGVLPKCSQEVQLQIFRIVQESLSNAVKHSDGEAIRISISGDENKCSFTVSDNGGGVDETHQNSGLGLSILAERNALIQQSCRSLLSITGAKPHGTVVQLEVWPGQPQ